MGQMGLLKKDRESFETGEKRACNLYSRTIRVVKFPPPLLPPKRENPRPSCLDELSCVAACVSSRTGGSRNNNSAKELGNQLIASTARVKSLACDLMTMHDAASV
jgi:hypothetical protein